MRYRDIIKEQREELENIEKQENIILRDRLESAKSGLKYPNILAILGVRRCGKSIFSHLLVKDKKFGYVNFDDERFLGISGKELDDVLQSFYELYGELDYVVFDEIQNVYGWELFVNRLRRTKKVILTGSNSKLLSGELSTHLTGRYIDIELFPFSFREYLRVKFFKESNAYTTKEKAEIVNFLTEYLQIGGFPESYKFGKQMTQRLYEDILTKDILLRYKINKIEELKKVAKFLVSNSTKEITYSQLARNFGIKHVSTISNWVNYLESSFLIFKLEKFDFKLKQQFIAPKKIFCIDSGLLNVVGFRFSDNTGRVMENEVAIKLKRISSEENFDVYYWNDVSKNEVDFVLKKGKTIIKLVQVTYASRREDIAEREIRSLIKASESLKCKNLVIITWDYENEEEIKNLKIKFVPLWKWLLE